MKIRKANARLVNSYSNIVPKKPQEADEMFAKNDSINLERILFTFLINWKLFPDLIEYMQIDLNNLPLQAKEAKLTKTSCPVKDDDPHFIWEKKNSRARFELNPTQIDV